ncbi:MAG: M24 family metallopeptidase [Clostridia bacterium]
MTDGRWFFICPELYYGDDKRVIEEQDLVILDFGCTYKGYCSDISQINSV